MLSDVLNFVSVRFVLRVRCGAFTNIVLLRRRPPQQQHHHHRVKVDIPPAARTKATSIKHQCYVGHNAPSSPDKPLLSGVPSSFNVVDLTSDVREDVSVAIFRA